jgi:hypothetical protein|tara:strand:+ start:20 stop:457 length:438 start_codon:yes stop_codon:yes gene_type:complete
MTNVQRLLDNDYNDYQNNYWWAHLDEGYNGLVYFNEDDKTNGTNLYHPDVVKEEWFKKNMEGHEHARPWIPRDRLEVVKYIEPTYNKLVLFDGAYFPHGAHFGDKRYFTKDIHKKAHWSNYRCNQVFFMHNKIVNTHGEKTETKM